MVFNHLILKTSVFSYGLFQKILNWDYEISPNETSK